MAFSVSVPGTGAFGGSPVIPVLYGLTPSSGHDAVAGGNQNFLRSDWLRTGIATATKPGDTPTGTIETSPFIIDETSTLTAIIGGGSTNRFSIHRASDDSEILGQQTTQGLIYDASTPNGINAPNVNWTAGDFAGAGVSGSTEVYLRVEDNVGGSWGHIQVDDIVVTNASFIPEPSTGVLGLLALCGLALRRRR